MSKPVDIPCAVWPVAVATCSGESTIEPTAGYSLVQKMNEANVFDLPAAAYRTEKVQAVIQIQNWWRGGASVGR